MTLHAVPYEQVIRLAEALPARDKVRLIQQLTHMLDQEYIAQLPQAHGWPPWLH